MLNRIVTPCWETVRLASRKCCTPTLTLEGDCKRFWFSCSSPEPSYSCAALLRCTMPVEQSCSSTPTVRSGVDSARRPAGSWPQAAHCRGQAAPRRWRGFQSAQEAGKGRARGDKRAGRGADQARTAAGIWLKAGCAWACQRGRFSGRVSKQSSPAKSARRKVNSSS